MKRIIANSNANYHKDIFPFDIPPIDPANQIERDIFITDTTFRDGQQAMPAFSTEQMVSLYKMMSDLGGENGLIRQTEFFPYSDKDRKAIEKCKELNLKFPEITTWVRADRKDADILEDLEIKETGVLMSCSDYHIFKKLKISKENALEKYIKIAESILDRGIIVRCHLEDLTRADIYGFVIPLINKLNETVGNNKHAIKFRLCDTLGVGLPYESSSLPRGIPTLLKKLYADTDLLPEQLEWHGHNDFYKAVVNGTSAWIHGVSAVNCTLLGIGERTGNIPLEAMLFEYASLKGSFGGANMEIISKIKNYFIDEISYNLPENTPFVGKNFNTTKAGIHADGLLKSSDIYNSYDTYTVLRSRPGVCLNKTSGKAGIAYWINSYYNLNNGISKDHPLVSIIYEYINNEYENNARLSYINEKEITALIEKTGWVIKNE